MTPFRGSVCTWSHCYILLNLVVFRYRYLKLIRDGDDDVYNKNAFDDSMVGKFIFCVVTSKADPSETMLAKMYPIRIAE